MDKYEYRLITDQIKEAAAKKDYKTAAGLCAEVDWPRVRDVRMLGIVADVYEADGDYLEAIEALNQAYQVAPGSRRIVYQLAELAQKADRYDEAKECYEEYCRIAPNDPGRFILLYGLACKQNAELWEKIEILKAYHHEDFDDRWAYELAELYAQAGKEKECVQLCNDIILWFGVGTYLEKALELKAKYEPLTPEQEEKAARIRREKENERLLQDQKNSLEISITNLDSVQEAVRHAADTGREDQARRPD